MTSRLSTKEEVVAFKVTGAGTTRFNGLYYTTEEMHSGVSIYSKTGNSKDREDDSFLMLYDNCWCISTRSINGIRNFDNFTWYYFCLCIPKSRTPPESGWTCCRCANAPPPIVHKVLIVIKPYCLITFEKMLFSAKFSDVHFHCPDGTILHAHRNILSAASPYFATVFEGPWCDEHPNGVWKTSNSADLMRVILAYIYISVEKEDDISKQPFAVLSLAHEYQLIILVEAAERILMQQIKEKNVKEILQSSILYNLENLKHSCFDFIEKIQSRY